MAKSKYVMPVVKWVGGKRQLIEEIKKYIPNNFETYYEPFFGGGAVLFYVQPTKAVINDINADLMTTYKIIKANSNELINSLKKHINSSDYFYQIRNQDKDTEKYQNMSEIEKASRLIYLNKTCFNGLFRVNSSGQFNTPFGNYKNPNIVNENVIDAVSKYFNESEIFMLSEDFESAVITAKKGDFVYFDPPYDPISYTSSFTGYNEGGFNRDEQKRLKLLCDKLDKKGVNFLLSNSATKFIKELYSEYNITLVRAKRTINANGSKRGEIDEVLIRNYK